VLVEGLAVHITGEWLRTLMTALPIVVGVVWVLRYASRQWREWIWRHGGVAQVHKMEGVTVQPRWGGWRLEAAGQCIEIRGSVRGVGWTAGRCGEKRTRLTPGLPTKTQCEAHLLP
jgi:hypothetical protein